jgi:hypothetical protein
MLRRPKRSKNKAVAPKQEEEEEEEEEEGLIIPQITVVV